MYALNTSDVEIQLPGGRFLQQIAAETGGKAWLPYMQQKEAAKATAEIERELRSVYAVSFVQSSQNGRINVKSRNKAVRISSTLVKH